MLVLMLACGLLHSLLLPAGSPLRIVVVVVVAGRRGEEKTERNDGQIERQYGVLTVRDRVALHLLWRSDPVP